MKLKVVLGFLGRLVLFAVFAAAAVPKIVSADSFAVAVFRYQILPHHLINVTAVFLPWLELIAALAVLLMRPYREAAACVMLCLLGVFACAMLANMIRGIDVACGCFSVNPEAAHMTWLNILRNVALMAVCVWIIASERRLSRAQAYPATEP